MLPHAIDSRSSAPQPVDHHDDSPQFFHSQLSSHHLPQVLASDISNNNSSSSSSPVHGNNFQNKQDPIGSSSSSGNCFSAANKGKGDIDRHLPFEQPVIFDFFASNCDPESEVYYTSNDPAYFEYNLDCEPDQFSNMMNNFNPLHWGHPQHPSSRALVSDSSFAHHESRIHQQQLEKQQDEEQINPMIVFETYCIPENFFDGQQEREQGSLGARVDHLNNNNNNNHPFDNNFHRSRTGKFRIKGGSTGRVIEKSKDYDKNICRYIARLVIRQFNSEDYTDTILNLTNCDIDTLDDAREVFLKQIENISGHRAFRELLIIKETDSDQTVEQKCIFQSFTKWFLKERAIRYIIKGDMKDQISYIRYKNDIMLYYVDCPHKWESNKCSRKRRLVRNQ